MKRGDPYYLTPEWKDIRRRRLLIDGYVCQHCGVKCLGKKKNLPRPHVDHVIPRSKGGSDTLDNTQTLCVTCHNKKTRAEEQDRPAIGADGYLV